MLTRFFEHIRAGVRDAVLGGFDDAAVELQDRLGGACEPSRRIDVPTVTNEEIDAIRTKADALAMAERHGVTLEGDRLADWKTQLRETLHAL